MARPSGSSAFGCFNNVAIDLVLMPYLVLVLMKKNDSESYYIFFSGLLNRFPKKPTSFVIIRSPLGSIFALHKVAWLVIVKSTCYHFLDF